MNTLITLIPSESASRSKMAKKGWKCWAKILSSVATPANNGYAFEGQFVGVGTKLEVDSGDVLLHVDQSSNAGVAVIVPKEGGENGYIWWSETASSDGQKWCASLGREARKLLAMTVEERIRYAAGYMVDDRPADRNDATQAHYERLAGRSGKTPAAQPTATAAVVAPDAAPSPRDLALVAIRRLMAEHSITVDDLT